MLVAMSGNDWWDVVVSGGGVCGGLLVVDINVVVVVVVVQIEDSLPLTFSQPPRYCCQYLYHGANLITTRPMTLL